MAEKGFLNNNVRKDIIEDEDHAIMEKVRKIVKKGKNAEIKQGADGKLKVYQVSKEIA